MSFQSSPAVLAAFSVFDIDSNNGLFIPAKLSCVPPTTIPWVDGFAIGVVRMLIGFARIRSVCEISANGESEPQARQSIVGRFAQYQEVLRILVGFARIRLVCESVRIANRQSRQYLRVRSVTAFRGGFEVPNPAKNVATRMLQVSAPARLICSHIPEERGTRQIKTFAKESIRLKQFKTLDSQDNREHFRKQPPPPFLHIDRMDMLHVLVRRMDWCLSKPRYHILDNTEQTGCCNTTPWPFSFQTDGTVLHRR